jgi:hypothetical protein|tara:strand:- start:5541 stop:6377 length:837 start_codon:yes stop_codon:yes gene_type:complete
MPNDSAPVEEADNAPEVSTSTPTAESSEDWRSALSEDIRDNQNFDKFKDVNALAASYVNLQSHLGRDKISKPVTDEDWNDVYEFLGRPEDPDKYEIELPEGLSEEVAAQFNDEALSSFKQEAHKLGLNSSQVKSLVAWQASNVVTQQSNFSEIQNQSIEDGERALKEEWGRAYDQNIEAAKKAFNEYGGDDLAEIMVSSGLGNNPAMLKAFANIAKTTMADKDLAGPSSGERAALTPEEAKTEAQSLMSHPAYLNKRHPEHAGIVNKVQNLYTQAYPE